MKKLSVLLLAILTVLTLSSCTPSGEAIRPDAPAVLPEAEPEANVPAVAATVPEAEPEANIPTVPAVPVEPAEPAAQSEITQEEAKSLALEHAGLAEGDVTFMHVHLDRDDGRLEYDVEFYCKDREYDYEIDALSGKILSFDSEPKHHAPAPVEAPAQQNDAYISKDEAKTIALSHAGAEKDDVHMEKAELDHDDGRVEYEIEFRIGRTEYEYAIDAVTGKVLKAEKDFDD